MNDRPAVASRVTGTRALVVGLALFAGTIHPQETGFERLWSHDTGG